MSFSAKNGRILTTDEFGNIRLDTDAKMFHTITIMTPGAINVPQYYALPQQRRLLVVDTPIGACHFGCTHVIGAVEFYSSAQFGIAFGRSTTYLGGDLVWAVTAPGYSPNSFGSIGPGPHTSQRFRFYASGGTVYMQMEVRLPQTYDQSVSLSLAPVTIKHWLEAGRWN